MLSSATNTVLDGYHAGRSGVRVTVVRGNSGGAEEDASHVLSNRNNSRGSLLLAVVMWATYPLWDVAFQIVWLSRLGDYRVFNHRIPSSPDAAYTAAALT